MDAKFKTPKFVTNTGSSSFVRELLTTVLATTISIALTFGTAAIIDFYKKQSEKQEIVMMVMYDMYKLTGVNRGLRLHNYQCDRSPATTGSGYHTI
jgi:hypothetical protein